MPHHRASWPLAAASALLLVTALAGCGDEAAQPEATASSGSTADASASPTRSAKSSSSPAEGPSLDLRIKGDDVSPTAETIDLAPGDVLTVQVDSDRAGELHVHSSPEQYVEFGAGRSRHRITLDKPGQVDVEEHESGALVARLLVG